MEIIKILWCFLFIPILSLGQNDNLAKTVWIDCNEGIRYHYNYNMSNLSDSILESSNSIGDFEQYCDKLIFPNKDTILLKGKQWQGGEWFNVSPNKKLVVIYQKGKLKGKSSVSVYNSNKEKIGHFVTNLIISMSITDNGDLLLLEKNRIKLLNIDGEIISYIEHKVEQIVSYKMLASPDNEHFAVELEVEYDFIGHRKSIILVLNKNMEILFYEETNENKPIAISPILYFNGKGILISEFAYWYEIDKNAIYMLPQKEKRATWMFDCDSLKVNKYVTSSLYKE